jgi:SAM-dependent methyltransferase
VGYVGVVEPFYEYWEDYDRWFDRHRNVYLSELAALESASRGVPRPWLEVGVGSGRFAKPLGVDVGVDPAEPMLVVARSRGLDVAGAVGEYLPLRTESFGGVFLVVTICFLENPRRVLSEVSRVLRPGGRLVVGFVPAESPWGRFYSELARRGHRFYRYARFYRVEEVEELVRGVGLVPELYVSTLRVSRPGSEEVLEEPSPGLWHDAGFVVLRALRTP